MKKFKLSQNSLNKLNGVDDRLIKIVKRAIQITKIDFGVIEGVRTAEKQAELVALGASKTLKSKHIEGKAVDLMVYVGSRPSWELNLYDDIADAMKQAAKEENVQIRWGAAWTVADFTNWPGTAEEAMNAYIDYRRKQGRRPYIDGPHFELMD